MYIELKDPFYNIRLDGQYWSKVINFSNNYLRYAQDSLYRSGPKDFLFMSNNKVDETPGVPITPPPEPTGIAFFKNPNPIRGDRLIVADEANHRILNIRLDILGSVEIIGGPGSGNLQFMSPKDVTVDSGSAEIYVADTGNHRVQSINLGQGFTRKWGSFGSGNGQFNCPSGISIDSSSGHVFVTDRGNNRIQVFKKDGEFVRVISFGSIIEP